MKTLTVATLMIAIAGLIYTLFDTKPAPDLSRFECAQTTLYASLNGKSPSDHCAGYGGLASARAPASGKALVILVRNQPAGGFEGEHALR